MWLLLTCCALAFEGQAIAAPAGVAPQASVREASVQEGSVQEMTLSLRDAIAMAIERNLDVEVQRVGLGATDADLLRAESGSLPRGVSFTAREGPRSVGGPGYDALAPMLGLGPETNLAIGPSVSSSGRLPPNFEGTISASLRRAHTTAPQVNSFQSGTTALVTDLSSWNATWQKGLRFGTELAFGFEGTRQRLNHRQYDLSPYATSTASVSIVQPLLRGFGADVNTRYIRIARNSRVQSDLAFRQQVTSTVAAVVRLYWDLVSLNEDARVRQQALLRAEHLLRDTGLQVEAGTRASIDPCVSAPRWPARAAT